MGFFSFITQDTKRSIYNYHTGKDFPVMMTDDKGHRWIEGAYAGYGDFGGKDYYELLAEMNGKTTREEGITLYYPKDDVQDKTVLFPNLTEDMQWTWRNERPDDCPYQGFFEGEDDEDKAYADDYYANQYNQDDYDLGGTGHGDESFSDADPGL